MRTRFVDLNMILNLAYFMSKPSVDSRKSFLKHIVELFIKSLFIAPTVFLVGFLVIPSAFAQSPQLKISGNHIVTASGGCTVRLKGVDFSGLEYSVQGDGSGAPTTTIAGNTMTNYVALATEAVNVWHANCVRLPINQDYWCGCSNSKGTPNAGYQAEILAVAAYCEANNVYMDLDLHWSGTYGGTSATAPCSGGNSWGTALGQEDMPDWNAVTFWGLVANTTGIKNNPAVMFDLYNEPHDVSWSVWRNGGSTGSSPSNTPGLQQLLTTIRGVGANNVCIAGGLNWAFDLTGVVGKASGDSTVYALTDTGSGNGVLYASHCYSSKGYTVGSGWDPYVTIATSTVPVLIEEFGATSSDGIGWTNSAIAWIDGTNDNNYLYSATAWAFSADVSPTLLTSFSGYPTSSYFGAPVSTWLYQLNETPTPNCGSSGPTNTATNTATQTATNTATHTATNTATKTATETATNTATQTATNTATRTSTNTATNSATNTATNTATRTVTNTATNTATTTSTSTTTNTPTNTSNITSTFTNTATNSSTSTATHTATNTVTQTATNTATMTSTTTITNTATNTPTDTSTHTSTNTPTNTMTGTMPPTNTPTNTSTTTASSTATNSATITSTNSATNTATHTATQTATNTATSTATHTATQTATNTATQTATNTLTSTPVSTGTFTNTMTNTASSTATHTPTNTATNSATNTATNTATVTGTSTPSNTATVTSTYTKTNTPTTTSTTTPTSSPTSTFTRTTTPTITPTYTPTVTSDIIISAPYPNPSYGSPIIFNIQVPGESTVTMDVFTLAFRKISSQTIQAYGAATLQWDLKDISGVQVANGLYYVRIQVTGTESTTRIMKVLILR
jgi:hypothetical protein